MMRMPKQRTYRPIGATRRHALEGLPLASFTRRLLAYGIDLIPTALLVGIASLPAVIIEGTAGGKYHLEINPFHGWALLSLPVYFGLATYVGHGQTIGKRIMRIRVISLAHDHLSLWHCVERALGYAASMLEGGFGFFQYFIHPNGQTVHDRIAETIVILDTPIAERKAPNKSADPPTSAGTSAAEPPRVPPSAAGHL